MPRFFLVPRRQDGDFRSFFAVGLALAVGALVSACSYVSFTMSDFPVRLVLRMCAVLRSGSTWFTLIFLKLTCIPRSMPVSSSWHITTVEGTHVTGVSVRGIW